MGSIRHRKSKYEKRIAAAFTLVSLNVISVLMVINSQYAVATKDLVTDDINHYEIAEEYHVDNVVEVDSEQDNSIDIAEISLKELEKIRVGISSGRIAEVESRDAKINGMNTSRELENTEKHALIALSSNAEDPEYTYEPIKITGVNRANLERLVMGEAGDEGFIGAALVAQAIRDTMVFEDEYNVLNIKKQYAYSAPLTKQPNEDTIKAVEYIFDEGQCAVKHRVMYFYAPRWVKNNYSDFHESQKFIVEHGGHRFFDRTW